MNILLIDDDISCLKSLSSTIESVGHKCDNYTVSEDAVRIYEKKNYDVVITDIRMPGMDGIEVLKKIRLLNPFAKVIVITAYKDDEVTEEVFNNGAFAIFMKPLDVATFMEMLKKLESGESEKVEQDLIIDEEMIKDFVDESLELLKDAEQCLLELEKTPNNSECSNKAFRALHSIKGNAGFMGYEDIEVVSHLAENILDQIKNEARKINQNIISALLTTVDVLVKTVNQLKINKDSRIKNVQEIKNTLNYVMSQLIQQDERLNIDIKGEKNERITLKDGTCENLSLVEGQQTFRISVDKMDLLLNLVGELVISKEMIVNSPDLVGLELEQFSKSALQLNKIIRDIQEVTMSIRMIPLSGTFQKITRLVRDLSVKANKKVDIEIIGDETEVDKTVIEQISDPLVHLIRNSVDHGIESPEERTKKGKTETGKITIEAKHSVGEVWITVTDDGEGLNKEKILNKAIEKGLIAKSSPNLTDDEVWQLIFEPGFSTAEQISNISGRGVGLDVVKRNVEKLGGRVEVYSKSGIETSFVIRIPLTMAIIDGMILKVGNSKYITPIISVKESLRPKPEQITVTPDGLEIVHIREELVPVIRLHELYKIKTDNIKLHEGILVVVESNGKKCCLFGDELLGNQQIVVKALPNYIGHVRSISGCTIMSDGEISMILDIGDLIKSVEG